MRDFLLFFITPPGLAIWPAAVALFLLIKRRRYAIRWLVMAVVFGWAFSTPAMGRLLTTVSMSMVSGPKVTQDVDAIVMLTGGMHYVGNGDWLPSRSSYHRAMISLDLQERFGSRTPIIISGGRTEGPRYPSEAKVVKTLIGSMRAQITPMILEEISMNTWESAIEVSRILEDRSARQVLLVTSESHMLRALAAYRMRGVDAAPVIAYDMDLGPWRLGHFFPSAEGVMDTKRAIYEVGALAYYLLAGHARWSDITY